MLDVVYVFVFLQSSGLALKIDTAEPGITFFKNIDITYYSYFKKKKPAALLISLEALSNNT